ncbi:uncharacterized protein LOC117117218 isoform X2 [Anneissia japonica]|uniref:uncharacterized protein LOC117117218 isoform X2 n=1 Tax=Anneissia japonica TaxID=1529436 RepID=UPI0014256296|nr:uncharacterized protein LOC117117218 isoform X2 [Anneissia japonica]
MKSQQVFEILKKAQNPDEEVTALDLIINHLSCNQECDITIQDLELQWLAHAGEDIDDNPFPAITPETFLPVQEDLNQFTSYVFERRFGWSEARNDERIPDLPLHASSSRQTGAKSMTERIAKGKLNEFLDDFIKWYMSQQLSSEILKSFVYTVSQSNNKPVVRNQTVMHVMEWFKLRADTPQLHVNFDLIRHLILLGIKDIWSAIRNVCVSRISTVVERFQISELQVFFRDLTQICESPESTWQNIEGALMAINSTLKRFHWMGSIPSEQPLHKSPISSSTYLKFGRSQLKQLPDFITGKMHSIIYPMLAHPQLSVREQATKAFSTYLYRCEFKEALQSFKEALAHLCDGTGITIAFDEEDNYVLSQGLPHHAVLCKDYQFLDAYRAEGLLGVCIYLIKHIPPGYLLPSWPLYFSTFNLYLMHPASTVRQAASAVFKYLVAKDNNNPSLLKLVLQGLCAGWPIDLHQLTDLVHPSLHITSRTLPLNEKGENGSGDQNINDEGSAGNHSKKPLSRQSSSPCKSRMINISTVCNMELEPGCLPDSLLSRSWEWREGRLFAYELIIKFLIINHIHYLFPSYALPPSKFDGTASTDDAMTPSHQSSLAQGNQIKVKKSYSHGGASLQQIWKEHGINKARHAVSEDISPESVIPVEGAIGMMSKSSPEKSTIDVDSMVFTKTDSDHKKRSLTEKRAKLKPLMSFPCVFDMHAYRKMLQRAQTLADGRSFKPTDIQKFSSPTRQCNAPASLLSQTLALDKDIAATSDESKPSFEAWSVKDPISNLTDLVANVDIPDDVILLKSCFTMVNSDPTSTQPDWLKHVHLEEFSSILKQILLQTIHCLANTRWELRRMGEQTLPLITECIRWYDMNILRHLWDSWFTPQATLIGYGMGLALKYSIHHAVRLIFFLEQPPASWKNPEMCRYIASSIVDVTQQGLSTWSDSALQLLSRPVTDKLSVIAMEILILKQSYFPHIPAKQEEETSIVQRLQHIFVWAHPGHQISTVLKDDSVKTSFQTVTEGFLCCCIKDSSLESYPRQVEKYLLTEIYSLLPLYMRTCSLSLASQILPLFLGLAGNYSEDMSMCKGLLDSCLSVAIIMEDWLHRQCLTKAPLELVSWYQMALTEITNIVKLKTLELSLLRQVLELYIKISSFVGSKDNINQLFTAITARLDLLITLGGTWSGEDLSTFDDFAFMSNDIPVSPVAEDRSSDEDEDDSVGDLVPESLALNSNTSGTHTPHLSTSDHEMRALTPTAGDEDDSGSEWDSWEEEEEDQSVLWSVFAEFLQKLKSNFTDPMSTGEQSVFHDNLLMATEKERQLINSLMDQWMRN